MHFHHGHKLLHKHESHILQVRLQLAAPRDTERLEGDELLTKLL